MHHPNPRRIVPVVVLVLVVLLATRYYTRAASDDQSAPIKASGTIEALEVRISPEVGGRITSLEADEGDTVAAGQLLAKLDDALIRGQIAQAEAALAAAQANLEAVTAAAGVTAATGEAAKAVHAAAEANLDLLKAGASIEQLAVAQTVVDKAQLAVDAAQEAYDDLSDYARDTTQGKTIKSQLDQAKTALENAVAQYDLLKAGARPQQIEAAQAQVDSAASQARAASRQVQASEAQIKAAQAQVDTALAAVDLLAIQLARFHVTSPVAGTVLFRPVEAGEVIAQGTTLMVIADLSYLEITVYVPEDRYGQIMLGQAAYISVDSFPDEAFTARVVHIADKAEFTPRNVQTSEGRRTTVFAVRLKLENQDGRLKPGMPADLVFEK